MAWKILGLKSRIILSDVLPRQLKLTVIDKQ